MENFDRMVTEALSRSDDDLYSQIGSAVFGEGMFPPSRRELIDVGRGWLTSKHNELAVIVCGSDRVRSLAKQDVETHEKVVAVCGVLDIASHVLGGVPVVTVAVLILRLGLHRFCAASWGSQT